jgi:spermidine synthase
MNPPKRNRGAAIAAAALYGLVYAKLGFDAPRIAGVPSMIFVEGLLHVVLLPFALFVGQQVIARQVVERALPPERIAAYHAWELWTWLVWVVGALVGCAMGFSTALTLALVAAQLGLQAVALRSAAGSELLHPTHSLAGLFLVSGFAALIYQVAWQRLLFTAFGVNSESVTAIVSVFMFGLGLGALLGGWLQSRFPERLVQIFVATELGIGLFGLVSVELIQLAGPREEPTMAGLVMRVYAVLGVPTLLMGATLPVLTSYFQRHFRNIGKTVGLLYAVNTIGSAIAAFATVQVLFVLTGLRASIALAAICNFATAWLVWRISRRLPPVEMSERRTGQAADIRGGASLSYPAAFIGLAAIGFISLSLEILWFRLLGFMTASRPEVFGMLLAAFLAGIAAGSLRAEKFGHDDLLARRQMVRDLMLAAAAAYLAIPVISGVTGLLGKVAGVVAAYAGAGLVAFWCGGVFPTLVHLAARDRRSGSASLVAWLYFGNIVGAALGPLLTGFVLLDRFDLGPDMALLGALTAVLAIFLAPPSTRRARIASLAGAAGVAWLLYAPLYGGYLERLQHAQLGSAPFKHVIQDRSAIITVDHGAQDMMYGHGIYDGRFNTDPVVNSNSIDRAYMVASLHREPKRILEIGLSTGSWTKVLSTYAPLKELVVVEIGRGYGKVVANYPDHATVLTDPRVRIILDDGRRWLRNHPGERFDVIVSNNTYYWRSNATNLLSRDFLELMRAHLNPGGVVFYNTLGSDDIVYTAAHVFKHVARFSAFVAASDSPFDIPAAERYANLLRFKLNDGSPVMTRDAPHRAKLKELAEVPLRDIRAELLARKDLWLITDDNMATEYKVRY